MLKSRIVVDRDFIISALDRRVFGTFVEHMGRCVYGGIYEPGACDRRRATAFARTCWS